MYKLLKQFGVLAARLRDKIVSDIFTSAHLRITLLYFFTGVVILTVAGILTYNSTIRIFNQFTEDLQSAITMSAGQALRPGLSTPAATTTPESEFQNRQVGGTIVDTTEAEIKKMIYGNILWVLLLILLSSYVLAGITLRPIRRAMENKKRFVANISHELRTPLSVMKSSSEVALMDADGGDKEEMASALRSNLEEVDRMSSILRFLFTFSNLEHVRRELQMESVDLADIAEKSVKTLRQQIGRKNIQVEIWKDPKVFARGNEVALEEVLLNLLKNSIRHTPQGGHVRIALEKKLYGVVKMTVKDSGEGMPAKDISRAFEPFYRGEKKNEQQAESKESAGLGLALTKEIVSLHHGNISIESKPGHGTSIEITLPAAI